MIIAETERERRAYDSGFQDALIAFAYSSSAAWAKNGVMYVGSCGTTLARAVAERGNNAFYRPSLSPQE